jgi:hypothetical protein
LASGAYEVDPVGRRCFRPHVPRIPPLEDVLDALDAAAAAVREFERALAGWQSPGLIGRLFARLDAVHSSGAEGSTTTFADLMEYESSLTRPAFTLEDARRAIGGTFASVNTAAARLVDTGILEIADHARRDRLFLARAVLDIFDRFRPMPARG